MLVSNKGQTNRISKSHRITPTSVMRKLHTASPYPSSSMPCFIARAYYGNMNFFGGPSTTSVKASTKLKQLEEENEDAMFVIISDVWLDNVEVMEKLNVMFSGLLLHHHRLSLHRSTICPPWDTNDFLFHFVFFPTGYASMPPTCFIFCGNFSSAPYGNTQIKSLKGETLSFSSLMAYYRFWDLCV